jgi:hypothetical protein
MTRRKPTKAEQDAKTVPPLKRGRQGEGGGRPRLKIPWKTVDQMFAACVPSCQLVADALGVSLSSLENYCRATFGMSLKHYAAKKRGSTYVRLRAKQIDLAMRGNVPLLIWLGKQYLEQKDKQEIEDKSLDTRIQIRMSKGTLELRDALQQAVSRISDEAGKSEGEAFPEADFSDDDGGSVAAEEE